MLKLEFKIKDLLQMCDKFCKNKIVHLILRTPFKKRIQNLRLFLMNTVLSRERS